MFLMFFFKKKDHVGDFWTRKLHRVLGKRRVVGKGLCVLFRGRYRRCRK